jgi:hypothetical protein
MGRIEKYKSKANKCFIKYKKGVLATQIFVIENYDELQTNNLRKEEKEELAPLFEISLASFMTQFATMMTLAEYVCLKDVKQWQ